jgi:hypothetical protein
VHGCKVLPSSLETRLSRIFSPEVALAHHICMTCLAYRHLCVAGCQRTVMIEPPMRSESFQLFPRALTRPSLHGILHLVSTSEADIRILRNGHDRLQLRLSFIPAPTKAASHGHCVSGTDTSVARSQYELRFVDHMLPWGGLPTLLIQVYSRQVSSSDTRQLCSGPIFRAHRCTELAMKHA